jgi:hypothetical protein
MLIAQKQCTIHLDQAGQRNMRMSKMSTVPQQRLLLSHLRKEVMVEREMALKLNRRKVRSHRLETRRTPPRKGRFPHRNLHPRKKVKATRTKFETTLTSDDFDFIVTTLNDASLEIAEKQEAKQEEVFSRIKVELQEVQQALQSSRAVSTMPLSSRNTRNGR